MSPSFWTDEDSKRWSDEHKLFALYLLTGPHRKTEGLYRLPVLYMAADIGWRQEDVEEALRFLEEECGWLSYDAEVEVVFIRRALSYTPPENANQVKNAVRNVLELPHTALLDEFMEAAEEYAPDLAQAIADERAGVEPATPEKPVSQQALEVFRFWCDVMGKNARTSFDPKRRRAVEGRLKEVLRGENGKAYTFTVDDLKHAILGCASSAFHMGDNDRNAKYNDLELICRNASKTEHFIELYEQSGGGGAEPDMVEHAAQVLLRAGKYAAEAVCSEHGLDWTAVQARAEKLGGAV